MTNLGGTTFFNVKYPLLLVDRFFRFYFDLKSGKFVTDVFRWDSETGEITYEVLAGVPQVDGIDRSPNGVVVIASDDGGFQYKIRSGQKKGSELFGSIPAGDEITVRINDRSVVVWRGKNKLAELQNGQVSGFPVGIRVTAEGRTQIGAHLPEGFVPPTEPTYGLTN